MHFSKIFKHLTLAFGLATLAATAGTAEQIGYGRMIVNDFLGDGEDRWRSGSIIGSHVFGTPWSGQLSGQAWDNIELRIMGQVIAPDNLRTPAAGDRAYAGALSIGAHTHFERSNIEYTIGGDVVVVGPQTGLADLQSWIHDQVNMSRPSEAVLSSQVGNQVTLTAVAEAGRVFALGEHVQARPFAEGRIGDETLVRVGMDVMFGAVGPKDLWVRDPVSGHRYRTMSRQARGMSYILGADIAYVDSSIYFPSDFGVSAEDTRSRLRAGLHWQGKRHSIFYGASWLSREFVGQEEGQVVGALRINFDF